MRPLRDFVRLAGQLHAMYEKRRARQAIGGIMAKMVLMDQFHIDVTAPRGLRKADCAAIIRTLNSTRFRKRLREAVRKLFDEHPSLRHTRFTINR